MRLTQLHFELISNAPTLVQGVTQTCHMQRILPLHRNPVLCVLLLSNFTIFLSARLATQAAHQLNYPTACSLAPSYICSQTYERMYACMYMFIYRMSMRVCICVPEWPACPAACLAPAYFVSWQHKQVAARCSVVFLPSNLRYCYNSAALCSFVRLLSI